MEAGDLVPGVEGTAVRSWASIPTDVLREIAGCIQGLEDYVSFASVCKSWHSSRFSSRWECPKSSKRRLEYPWLMLVDQQQGEEEEEECVRKRAFYSLYSGKQFNLDLPESYGRACYGSSCGWLLTMGLDLKMHLLNPITRQQLPLPSYTTLTDRYDPDSPEFIRRRFINKFLIIYDGSVAATEVGRTPLVFLLHNLCGRIAMARPGDTSWTLVGPSVSGGFFDVSSFRDQVVIYNGKRILTCHFSESPPRLEDLCAPPPNGYDCYIVDLGGELYTLCSSEKPSPRNGRCMVKRRFRAYKLDLVNKTWEGVDTLGGWAVFVGRNSSFALSSSDYLQCRPNCIYFTDENVANFDICGGCDWGIYHYENRSKDTESYENDTDSEESDVEGDTASEESEVEEDTASEESEVEEDTASEESEVSEVEEDTDSDERQVKEEYPGGLFNEENPYIPDNRDEITLNPFPISHDQFSTYSPLLWVSPNLW